MSRSSTSGSKHTATRHRRVTREVLGAVPSRGASDNKYTAGAVARRRRIDRVHGRSFADRRGGDAGRRGHRHGLRPGAAERRVRAPARRGHEPALPVGRGRSHDGGRGRARSSRPPRRRRRSRSGPASAAPTARASSSDSSSIGWSARSCSTPTGSGRSSGHHEWVFARDAPTVLTPACRRAGSAARPGLELGRCEPARGRVGRRRRRGGDGSPEGRRHARRRAGPGRSRLQPRESRSRHCGHGRRPDRDRGRVPGQGNGRTDSQPRLPQPPAGSRPGSPPSGTGSRG